MQRLDYSIAGVGEAMELQVAVAGPAEAPVLVVAVVLAA
jgi:hypothetical protein